jgi:parallel beta-helix repeat protein
MHSFARTIGAVLLILTITLPLVSMKKTGANLSSSIIRVPQDFLTIQEALDNANSNDTIYVSPGIYNESFTVNKASVRIVGEDKNTTIIDLGHSSSIQIAAENTSLSGFSIRSGYPYALYIKSNGTTVENNIFESNSGGIYCGDVYGIDNVTNNLIIDNEIRHNSDIGLYLDFACNNVISGNNFSDNYWGITLYDGSANNIISNNNLYDTTSSCINIRESLGNVVSNNYLDSGTSGIYVDTNSNDTVVSQNSVINIQRIWGTIYVINSGNVSVKNNFLFNNSGGIYLDHAVGAFIENNTMQNNKYGLGINGDKLTHFIHTISSSNKINGKPVLYFVNQQKLDINSSLYPETSSLFVVNSTDIKIEDLQIANNWQGILLAYTYNSEVTNVTVSQNLCGIDVVGSLNNSFIENNMLNNTYGMRMLYNSVATVYKNNFVNNTNQVLCSSQGSVWDNGAEGNFWSDYSGQDTNQDGIGDVQYTINSKNQDNFPLVSLFSPSKVFYCGTWDQIPYYVTVNSNSTVAGLIFEPNLKRISFNVTGPKDTEGFCKVTVPKSMLDGIYEVRANDSLLGFNIQPNESYNIVFFRYNHSTENIRIMGTIAVPEFGTPTPYYSISVLFLLLLFFLVLAKKTRKQLG